MVRLIFALNFLALKNQYNMLYIGLASQKYYYVKLYYEITQKIIDIVVNGKFWGVKCKYTLKTA